MPNLQELLPFFQQLFQQWSEFTLHNVPYAVTLALTVWLVTAIGYSISIGVLKLRNTREVKARIDVQTSLEAAQQQLQATQEQLTTTSGQLEQTQQQAEMHAQRANKLEQKLLSSSKQLSESIAALVEKFELLDNAPAPNPADPDALWHRYGAIIGRVGERFQNEQQAKARLQLDVQAEKSKLADKDAVITSLQSRLDLQTHKLAELEQAATEQQTLQQELEALKQRLLISQDKHRFDSARIHDLEKSGAYTAVQSAPAAVASFEPVVRQEIRQAAETPVAVATKAVIEDLSVEQEQAAPQPAAEPAVAKPAAAKAPGKLKGLFGNAMEKFSKLDAKLGSSTTPKASVEPEPVAAVVSEEVEAAEPIQAVVETVAEVSTTKPTGFANKLGGMLGGLKKTPTQPVVEQATNSLSAAEPTAEEADVAIPEPTSATKKPGKLGGLLGKFKK